MAKKQTENLAYEKLREAVKNRALERLYAFWGEERYLLDYYVRELRGFIPEETEEFNHKRLDGKTMTTDMLMEAVDAIPVFSDIVLVEINDFDFSKTTEETRGELLKILSDIPEYVCVLFIFDTIEFKLDARIKPNAAIKKLFESVEFRPQEESALIKWTAKHFKDGGKRIDNDAARHLVFMTGGSMTLMKTEIEKLIAYCREETVTKNDINTVVTPVLEAAAYELTDAIISGNGELAVQKLGELLLMNEAPHKIHYSISIKLRQMLAARVLFEAGKGISDLVEMFSIKYEFQARSVFNAAKRISMDKCRKMVKMTADTAYKLNSSSQDGGEVLTELIVMLALAVEGKI